MADQRQTELPSGNDPTRLSEVRGWNWGAFFFTWLWAFAHRLPVLGVVSLIIFLTPVLSIFTLVFAVHLGRRGSELAWRRRPFASLEDLRATQRAWAAWGFRVVIVVALLASLAWPPLHWPPARHGDCARCHLKRTERFLRERRRRAAAPPRARVGAALERGNEARSRRPQTPQSDVVPRALDMKSEMWDTKATTGSRQVRKRTPQASPMVSACATSCLRLALSERRSAHDNWQGQVVQRGQGIRLHRNQRG